MSSDDGGLGTGSSSVRRSLYSRGAFAGGRAWLGACFRLLAAASLFSVVGVFFRLVMGVVLDDVRAWTGARFRVLAAAFLFFRVVAGVVLGDVPPWLAAGFRLLAAVFPFFRIVVLLVPVILVVRDLAFGRLAERRSAGDFRD
jgi:hypothetical protein